MIRYLTERLPVMICPRWVITRTQPIAIGNVIAYLVAALGVPESVAEIYRDRWCYRRNLPEHDANLRPRTRSAKMAAPSSRTPAPTFFLLAQPSHADSRSHCSPTHRRTSHRGGLHERISQETISRDMPFNLHRGRRSCSGPSGPRRVVSTSLSEECEACVRPPGRFDHRRPPGMSECVCGASVRCIAGLGWETPLAARQFPLADSGMG